MTGHRQEPVLVFDENGSEPAPENVAHPFVTAVEILCIYAVQPAHASGKICLFGPEKNLKT